MHCVNCGKAGTKMRFVTGSYGKGEDLLVLENVPLGSCPHCGESYMTAQTLRELERIKQQRHQLATKRLVAVAEFG